MVLLFLHTQIYMSMAQSSQKINTLTKSQIEEFIINHLKLYSPPISD